MTGIAELQAELEKKLAAATESAVEIANFRQMAGGASQEMWRLDLRVAVGPWQGEHALVMRRDLGGKIYAEALDRAAEFRVLQAAYAGGVPSPRPYWLLDDVSGRPALLMQRLEGETIGRRIVREPAFARARECLPAQMGAALASIHKIDLDVEDLRQSLPAPGTRPALRQLDMIVADLDRIGEPHPALELALRWLRRNEPPPPSHLVLVHGDFRIGNMVVNSDGLVGVLDWEFAHIGDPYEDLAWGLVRDWRFGADSLPMGGVGQPDAFFAAYQAHGGEPVDRARVMYWELFGNVRWAAGTLNQAERYLRGGEANLEFASLGRRCAEMEWEALRMLKEVRAEKGPQRRAR